MHLCTEEADSNPDDTKAIEYAGDITRPGTPVSAENMNHIEQGVFDAASTADQALSAAADNLVTAKSYADTKKAEAEAYTDEKIGALPTQAADAALNENSTNPIQNAPVAKAINELRSVTLYCTLPTQSGSLTYLPFIISNMMHRKGFLHIPVSQIAFAS